MANERSVQPARGTMKLKAVIAVALLFLSAGAARAQKVIRLYTGPAPGSEKWTQQEKEYFSTVWNTQVVTNVTQPTLTVYAPEPANATRTAVIICPGGAFHALSIQSEGIEVAKWLSARGVTALVLRYRLVQTGEDATKELAAKMADRKKLEEDMSGVIPLAVADGLAAVHYVRQHAAELGVSPRRIGIMGFSAGGTVAAAVAFGYSADSRPDFVAPIYPYMGGVREAPVPNDAPPMFIAAASDDELGLAPDSVSLYGKWLAARKSVELHMYSRGGHGFGMTKKNLPSDHWIERFGEWLRLQGLLQKET